MRETAIFFLYLLGCLLLGAALTYPLLQTGWVDHEPHRVMSRLAQLCILLGLWPFLRALGLADRRSLGYGPPRAAVLGGVAAGWLAGIGILLALALAELLLAIRVLDPRDATLDAELGQRAVQALIGGLLIGVLEETFFRGALFAAIRRRGSAAAAIVWSALLYAAVHFLKPGAVGPREAFDWTAVAQTVAGVFTDAFAPANLDSFVALVLVGVFLGLVRERTGHIGWCIGLHAGWVFVIQVMRHLTDGNAASPYAYLTGSYDGVIGWLAAGWLAVQSAGYWAAARRTAPRTDPQRRS